MNVDGDPSREQHTHADALTLDFRHCATDAADVLRLSSRFGHREMKRIGQEASPSLAANGKLVARQGNVGAGVVGCDQGAEGTHVLGAQLWIST